MLKPMEGAPASAAPLFAASMIPGPPPVAMTLSRRPPFEVRAPPRSEAKRANARASRYHRECVSGPSSRTRADPKTTMVDRTPHDLRHSSAFVLQQGSYPTH